MGAKCMVCEMAKCHRDTKNADIDSMAMDVFAEEQVGAVTELVAYDPPGQFDYLQALPEVLGKSQVVVERDSTMSTTDTDSASLPSVPIMQKDETAAAPILQGTSYDRQCSMRSDLSIEAWMSQRDFSDMTLLTGRPSGPEPWQVSSYPVCEALSRFPSRHVLFAPSPTHSVHRSEMSVAPYAEVYGAHPSTFDFNKQGHMIRSSECAENSSDSEDEVDFQGFPARHQGAQEIEKNSHFTFTPKAKMIPAPRAPPGAMIYH